jgi:beta-galactosidase GanA
MARTGFGASFAVAVTLTLTGAIAVHAQARDAGIPQLRRQGTATQLVVDGAPYLIRGGELGNSSASSLEYLRPFWPKLRAMHLNTVIAPVYWELMEPSEGRYAYTLIDGLIADARASDMRLVLLWFGSWKNSMSSYAPLWVKTDQRRFPRTESTRGRRQEILSPFSTANADADARAFAALMRHLRTVDGARHTVLMVQVENEVGMIPEARDHSATADSLFARPVPKELTAYLQRHRQTLAPELRARWDARGSRTDGNWEELFGAGPQTDELFMAWHFARFTEHVTAAGTGEYPLPMYVNAALMRPGYAPGRYPSAGPLPHLINVWRAGAPSIDFLAPDIYFPNFAEWTGLYVRSGNPLFIPEAGLNPLSGANALLAVGAHDAIGFSPFAIESASDTSSLAQSFALLAQLTPLILAHQGRGTMTAVQPPTAFDGTVDDAPQQVRLGDYTLTVTFQDPFGPAATATTPRAAIVIALAPNEFLVAGTGVVVTFAPNGPGDPIAGIASIQQGRFTDGRWVGGRWLNGDQNHQGRHLRIPAGRYEIQRVRLYRYH